MNSTVSFRFFLPFIFLIVFLPQNTEAQQRPVGLGLVFGSPTGFSFKYWKSRENAYDAGAAWSLGNNGAFQLHGDYLWHRFDITEEERTPLYYGIGVRLILGDDHSGIGIRIPGGITHLLRQDPFDFFFEVAPVFTLVPDTGFDLDAGIGVRFYFK